MSAEPREMAALLADGIGRYVEKSYGFEARRAWLQNAEGFSRQAWSDYAGLGWLALRMPEQYGGLDAGPEMLAPMMAACGAGLLLEPLLVSAVVGTGILIRAGSRKQQEALFPPLADGSLMVACAHQDSAAHPCRVEGGRLLGEKLNVLHGHVAGKIIVASASSTGAVLVMVDADAPGVERNTYRLVDGRCAARLRFNGAEVELLDAAPAEDVLSGALDDAALALCAEDAAIISALVSGTTQYVKVRKQFGRAIGANQALQHRLADLYLLQEEAAALTADAQLAAEATGPERTLRIAGARAYIIGAARKTANEAVQMHGGVGITDELAVSHYFRRIMVNAALFGSRTEHFEQFLQASAAQAAEPGHAA